MRYYKIHKLLLLQILLSFVEMSVTYAHCYVDYVNPLVGTLSNFELSNGNTYPAVARPWGMHFWTPQTGKMGNGWQYTYTDNKIRGFKQTHQPSPWINDYGQFSIMPITGKPEFNEEKRASWFSHKSEISTPYYYRVYLAQYDIVSEMTVTERAAMFRFTFPKSEGSYIVVDAFDKNSYIKIDRTNNRIIGYSTRNSGGVPKNFKNYFVIEFDKKITYQAVVKDGIVDEGNIEINTNHAGAIIGFKTNKEEFVHARVASSFISYEQAFLNLNELNTCEFNQLVDNGRKVWNDVLGKIEVESESIDQYRTFYSCLYRSVLFPRKFYEIDKYGKVVHYSPYNGNIESGYMYTDTGFWDTFRSLFPLLNLVYPSINKEIQEGLINAYKESGFFPEWASPGHRDCMIGNNSASVIVDAYMKGVKVEDLDILYKGLLHGTSNSHSVISSTGRLGYEYYNNIGYVPYDVGIKESAARTLEYSYNDWCIYKLAKELKRPRKEIKLYEKRAKNYCNVFNEKFLLMCGRNCDGTFDQKFSPFKWGDAFTEGNSWHYTWSVFHDPQGLINLMGGNRLFTQMLDSVFTLPPTFDDSYYGFPIHEIREMTVMNMGNYAHGNQPIQHMIYLYNYAKQPWKAQYWLRQIMDRMYTPKPDGYCGDEDNGQTSAWYVFSSLGFYPVCPGSNQYVLGSPLFKKAIIHLENGKDINILVPNNGKDSYYIFSMLYNNEEYTKNYLIHDDLILGADIKFNMSTVPNKQRGINNADLPYSLSNE